MKVTPEGIFLIILCWDMKDLVQNKGMLMALPARQKFRPYEHNFMRDASILYFYSLKPV